MIHLWQVLLVVISALLNSLGVVLIKRGIRDIRKVAAAMLLCAVSIAVFVPALKGGALSVLYPVSSLSYAFAAFFSVWFLGEKMSAVKWLGITFIIAGVCLISLEA